MALLLVQDLFEVVDKLQRSYEYLNASTDKNNHQLFKILSTLSDSVIPAVTKEKTESEKEKDSHVKKNYRGTC